MSDRSTPHISPMEGKGFYNRYAAVQAGGGALALPLLEQAARLISVGAGDRPLIIADYGSSQGEFACPHASRHRDPTSTNQPAAINPCVSH